MCLAESIARCVSVRNALEVTELVNYRRAEEWNIGKTCHRGDSLLDWFMLGQTKGHGGQTSSFYNQSIQALTKNAEIASQIPKAAISS